MSAHMDQRVAGMALLYETEPLGFLGTLSPDRPHEPTSVREQRLAAEGRVALAPAYAPHAVHRPAPALALPARHIAVRVPLERRWRFSVADLAALALAGLAVYGAVRLMDAIIRAGGA